MSGGQLSNYHKFLVGQIGEALGQNPEIPDNIDTLLQLVSNSYAHFDQVESELDAKVKLRTEQLIASTSKAYSFLDSLNMGFVMCDVNGQVVLVNESFRATLASKATDDKQAPDADKSWTTDAIDELFKPEIQLKEQVKHCLETAKSWEHKDVSFGARVLNMFFAPMLDTGAESEQQQIGIVILAEDVTEQKQLERSKDEFLSIASHELRTPLTAIRGNSAMLQKYYADSMSDEDMAEMIGDIHESSVRLIGIVNDFLDVSAFEQGKIKMNPQKFSLKDVISDVIRELQSTCDAKGIALVQDESVASAPDVMGDTQRIKQVIYNLVGNATKFTEKGSITIATKADDDFVYTVVTDTGRGMSPESQALLFHKFQQAGSSLLTRDTTKGTGLGLYISKLIVELSGGSIGLASSEVGKGSSFSFSLPRA